MIYDTEGMLDHLKFLYGAEAAGEILENLLNIISSYKPRIPSPKSPSATLDQRTITEEDAVLITYGDMVTDPGKPPLQVLGDLLVRYLQDMVSTIHLLPFYPYSSDDGFAIIDYKAVNPALGSWEDVGRIGRHFRLMFDAVINHMSAESNWFQAYLSGEPGYSNFFISVNEESDFSSVFRPRDLPLFTPVQSKTGPKLVWTTFSSDQIDLNYANPKVLLAIVDTLLWYAVKGAEFIRLDAIAYLWKEEGTSSINLPQTHRIIQILRMVLDMAAPHIAIITETNVPHEQNISYFGDGYNEAQLVYNFSLPPLVLHAFQSGDASKLSNWASRLETPSDQSYFFNFLASHDGIGLRPALGILNEKEIDKMAQKVEELGGSVSYRANPDGSKSPYELNINYLDALSDFEDPNYDLRLISSRFLTSQAIMLAIQGVPGIYFHSIFGSRGWIEGVKKTGLARTINRQKLNVEDLRSELAEAGSLRSYVYQGYRKLMKVRRSWETFHPSAGQSIKMVHPSLFTCLRTSIDGTKKFVGIHNVSRCTIQTHLNSSELESDLSNGVLDLLNGRWVDISRDGDITVSLPPYGTLWLGLSRED
ncbi:MAG: alpha-amylase family glycosyl hydrolase [Anaerolineae bacterium]|nr:MAG: alpha-amylase family glycosyl hydrolase [Anaerolineae bacterium]